MIANLRRRTLASFAVVALLLSTGSISAQLFESLKALDTRLKAAGGPKGLAVGDLDGDGRRDIVVASVDGALEVHRNLGDGGYASTTLDHRGASLREVIIADLDADGDADIAAADSGARELLVFDNDGAGGFDEPQRIATFGGARNLAAGDFDGDGLMDIVVVGRDVGLREYRGGAGGSLTAVNDRADVRGAPIAAWSARPVYSVAAFRVPGLDRDEVIATNAFRADAVVFSRGAAGKLEVAGRIPFGEPGVFWLAVGAIRHAAASEERPDLVTVNRENGFVQVRAGSDRPARFAISVSQHIELPGAPRAAAIVDLDGDGWNDLAVVLRDLDRVIAYRNVRGRLEAATEMVTGASPREIHAADFDGDASPDLAIINRDSRDLSVLPGQQGSIGFDMLDSVYLVDGGVADLEVADLDGDGRDDVIQIHRDSWEMSVRLAGGDGALAPPVYFAMGQRPNSLDLTDVDGDGRLDAVSANLGRQATVIGRELLIVGEGTVGLRYGDGRGGFGDLVTLTLPEGIGGQLFGLAVADFDRDGHPDLATAFFDCRLMFFRGLAGGAFEALRPHVFAYEARDMAVGDFDRDGDLDLAGIAYTGQVVVVENTGEFLTDRDIVRTEYAPPSREKFGSRDIRAVDLDLDGDLDLVSGTGKGVMVYLGGEGMGFTLATTAASGVTVPATSVSIADFDGNGRPDIAVSCAVLSCVIILTQEERDDALRFVPALTVDVPSGKLLRTGDVDGDGHVDLIGSGEKLWTALSGRSPKLGSPEVTDDRRAPLAHPVINEILAINNDVPLNFDSMKKPDFVEVYNGAAEQLDLAGWTLVVEAHGGPALTFAFPAGFRIDAGDRAVVIYSSNDRSPLHTGFKIPGGGAALRLVDASGSVVDAVDLPPQFANVAYARFRDGLPAFVYNPVPTPGSENGTGGATVAPSFVIEAVEPAPIIPGQPIRFIGRGRDDVGIVSASIVHRRIDVPEATPSRIILFDDGFNGDGAMSDGLFAGTLAPGLPADAELEFFIEIEDLDGNKTRLPNGATFDKTPSSPPLYSFAVGSAMDGLEISEVVSLHESLFDDPRGGSPDYVEVRNCSDEPISLLGYCIGKTFPMNDGWYRFPALTLAPGDHHVVLCDGRVSDGPDHADFTIDSAGDRVLLIGCLRQGQGAAVLVDGVAVPPLAADMAWARGGCGGPFEEATPTPGAPNAASTARIGDVNRDRSVDISDATSILLYLFHGSDVACPAAGEVNADGKVNISDAVALLDYLFRGREGISEGTVSCDGEDGR